MTDAPKLSTSPRNPVKEAIARLAGAQSGRPWYKRKRTWAAAVAIIGGGAAAAGYVQVGPILQTILEATSGFLGLG